MLDVRVDRYSPQDFAGWDSVIAITLLFRCSHKATQVLMAQGRTQESSTNTKYAVSVT